MTRTARRRVFPCSKAVAFAAAIWCVNAGSSLLAQENVLDKVDQLQLVSLSGSVGFINVAQVVGTTIYGITADYGPISPAWRLDFGISYWSSRFTNQVVQTFVDTLQKSLVNPTGTAYIQPSPVKIFDVTFDVGVRHTLAPRWWVTPFVAAGLSAHVINAEGSLIQGTFVERSLDAIAAGAFVSGGVQTHVFDRIILSAMARADLLSGFRSAQVRVGGGYFFGEPKRTPAK